MECSDRKERARKIALLNDELRRTLSTGRVVMSAGFAALAADTQIMAIRAVRSFGKFNEDNDPYGEHDFGCFEVDRIQMMWKIDYYDLTLTYHSPDPSDPAVTRRVLTIMLAEDY